VGRDISVRSFSQGLLILHTGIGCKAGTVHLSTDYCNEPRWHGPCSSRHGSSPGGAETHSGSVETSESEIEIEPGTIACARQALRRQHNGSVSRTSGVRISA